MFGGSRTGKEDSICRDVEALHISDKLVRTVSKKWRKKKSRDEADEGDESRGASVKCLSLYSRVGNCKVGADTSDEHGDPYNRRRSSSTSEDGRLFRSVCGSEEAGFDCFSYGVREKFWRKNTRKEQQLEESVQNSRLHIFLPDDILELCLLRLPLSTLMNARLVCKKWKYLTTSQRFLRMRHDLDVCRTPWLFLFGAVRDGHCSGDIHALDVQQDRWHRIDSDVLKGRFMFSVASIREEIFIVGGCSSLSHFGRLDRSNCKTHKGVLAFCPLSKSWRKISSMKCARSMPILGIFETFSSSSHTHRQEKRILKSRVGNASEIYQDAHRPSSRRSEECKSNKFIKPRSDRGNYKECARFVLVAVGGLGSWDESLDTGEAYDSATNKWSEIPKLPSDFGVACCGVICNAVFYVYSEADNLMGFDVERGYWMGIETTPFPPRVHEYCPKLVSCNNRLFMLSVSWCEGEGEIGHRNKAVRKLWELDLVCRTWSEASVHPDAPMDWNAAFVADKNLIFGVEMFKIFGQVLNFLTVCKVADDGDGMMWSHVSRKRMVHQPDGSSRMTKSMVVLNL